jgi:hypothetical protein
MKAHRVNKLNNFISGWYLHDNSICDELINFYLMNPKSNGSIGSNTGDIHVNTKFKKNTEVPVIEGSSLWKKYILEYLQPITEQYIELYPYVNEQSKWTCVEGFNIQHYDPGEAFYGWHCERSHGNQPMGSRHMVFMTYLNTVTDGGETEFYHQKISVKPEKGLTLIWPVDWPFTHRGVTSKTQEKFIVTGWYSFY